MVTPITAKTLIRWINFAFPLNGSENTVKLRPVTKISPVAPFKYKCMLDACELDMSDVIRPGDYGYFDQGLFLA